MKESNDGPRIAPSPERREGPAPLDVAVIIPCYDEGLGVIDTLESIATQRKQPGNHFVQGAVVVINNQPDASAEVLSNNMRTYAALQAMRFGYGLTTGDKDRDAKIKRIQESGMRVEVVDAFSGLHAHPENNVGYARKVGADHALGILDRTPRKQEWRNTEQPVLMSTDADTVLSPDTLNAVWTSMWAERADAVSVGSALSQKGLDEYSDRAARGYRMHWFVRTSTNQMQHRIQAMEQKLYYSPSLHPRPPVEATLVTLGGASSAYSARAYEKSGGYRPLGTAEDTELGFSIVETGGKVADLSKDYPGAMVVTQPRISKRTTRGFGHSIAEWDPRESPFGEVEVDNPRVAEEAERFFWELAGMPPSPKHRLERSNFEVIGAHFGMPPERVASLWGKYEAWGGVDNSREHHDFVRSARGFFEEKHGTITMEESIKILEGMNERYWESAERTLGAAGNDAFSEMWSWKAFSKAMIDLVVPDGFSVYPPEERADVELKARAAVASGYGLYVSQVVHNFQMLLMRAIIEAADKQRIDEIATMRSEIRSVLKESPKVDKELYVAFVLAMQASCQVNVLELGNIALTPHRSPQQIMRMEAVLKEKTTKTGVFWHNYHKLEALKKTEAEEKPKDESKE